MTRTDYKQLNQLSITEIETIFSGYESLVHALEAQTHVWRQPVAQASNRQPRGFARLLKFAAIPKVAKRA